MQDQNMNRVPVDRHDGDANAAPSRNPSDFERNINLSPRDKAHGWAPYIWLAYLSFFLLDPILNHAGWKQWLLTAIGTVIFLVLYFGLFWLENSRALWHIAGMMILGLLFAPINSGASTFFVFAAAFVPFCVQTE